MAGGDDEQQLEVNWLAVLFFLVVIVGGGIYAVRSYFHSKEMGKLRICQMQLENLVTAARMYANDNAGVPPKELSKLLERKYIMGLPKCPSASQMTYTAYEAKRKPFTITLSCCGGHHRKVAPAGETAQNFPTFTYSSEVKPK
jgi:hypothetical protein